jgi:transposase
MSFVLIECEAPAASVAKVAMAHGINANVVHSWRKRVRQALEMPEPRGAGQQAFVSTMRPPALMPTTATQPQVQIRRGAMAISVAWSLEAAVQLAIWTRELLK